MAKFSHLMAPGRINRMELRNRIFLTPMGSNLAEEDGYSGEKLRAYYAERAKGGAALITMGSVSVGFPEGSSNYRQEAISHDKYIPGVRAIADALHGYGAKLSIQLHHAGLTAMNDMLAGRPVACPSIPTHNKTEGDFGTVMLEEEAAKFFEPFMGMAEVQYDVLTAQSIERIVQMFATAADRAKRAGADAVEVHGGHGYLFSSFLSPAYNSRTDEYGGSVDNRSRFLCDTIRAIRDAVGPDFPVWSRIDSQEYYMDDGITIEDAKRTAYLIQEAGADAIHVSAHGDSSRGATFSMGHATDFRNAFVSNAAAIKSVVDVPVICPGRIEPEDADRFIAEGKLDFVTMGRKLLADPYLPNKLAAGKIEEVRPCIYCYTCISQIFLSKHVICAVNPRTGFELERLENAAEKRKTVLVIGGGPGGMYSAKLLADKGHHVILCEASDRLGGTAQFASIAYQPNQRIVAWLKRQVAEGGIDVRMKTRVTPEFLSQIKPDEVVVATGAKRTMPPMKGSEQNFVYSGDDMRKLVLGVDLDSIRDKTNFSTRAAVKLGALSGVTKNLDLVREASKRWMPIGKQVVIVGGELVGLELAEFLAHRGRTITVLEEGSRVGKGLMLVRRFRVVEECSAAGVAMITQVREVEIGDHAVSYVNGNGQRRSVHADTVIVAKGATGDTDLADAITQAGYIVHRVGDCTGVGYIEGAMRDAQLAAEHI